MIDDERDIREFDWGGCHLTDHGSVEDIDALIGKPVLVMGEPYTVEAIWLKEGSTPWPGPPWPRPMYRVRVRLDRPFPRDSAATAL